MDDNKPLIIMMVCVFLFFVAMMIWFPPHFTKKEMCVHDCSNGWTGVLDWTCVQSCMDKGGRE